MIPVLSRRNRKMSRRGSDESRFTTEGSSPLALHGAPSYRLRNDVVRAISYDLAGKYHVDILDPMSVRSSHGDGVRCLEVQSYKSVVIISSRRRTGRRTSRVATTTTLQRWGALVEIFPDRGTFASLSNTPSFSLVGETMVVTDGPSVSPAKV